MYSFNLNYYGAASEITANLLPTPFSDTDTIPFDPNMTTALAPKFQNEAKMSTLITHIQYLQGNKVRKRNKRHTDQKGRSITLLEDDVVLPRKS